MKPPTSRFTARPVVLGELRILGMGLHEQMPCGLLHRPHGMGCYLLALFHTATTIYLRGAKHDVPAQSLLVWEPDALHHYGNTTATWEYSWLMCDGPAIQLLLETLAFPCNRIVPVMDSTSLDRYLHDLYREYAHVLHPQPDIIRNLLHNVLLEATRQRSSPETSMQLPTWAVDMKQHLEVHYAEPLTLAKLAEFANLSVTHFCRKFTAVFEKPPIEYLIQVRMQVAKFLLLDNNLSVTEIALRTGYDDPRYFATLFRRYYGISPQKMRKGLSGEAGRQQRANERRSRELARWLHEGWQLVLDEDYAQLQRHDPRLQDFWSENFGSSLPAQQSACVTDACLRLPQDAHWTGLCWETPLGKSSNSKWWW